SVSRPALAIAFAVACGGSAIGKAMAEPEMCLICHDCLLEKPVSVPECGHAYHRDCLASWLAQSKGECPQCKQRCSLDQLRHLDLEAVPIVSVNNAQLQEDRDAGPEQRRQTHIELRARRRRMLERLGNLGAELESVEQEAVQQRTTRRQLEEEGPRKEEEKKDLDHEKQQQHLQCAEMQMHLDQEQQKQHQKLPIAHVREDDPDALEERRKHRPQTSDRCQALHGSLHSSRVREAELQQLARDRKGNADQVEQDLSRVRKEVDSLRQKSKEAPSSRNELPSSQGMSSDSGLSAAKQEFSRRYSTESTLSTPPSPAVSARALRPVATPCPKANVQPLEDEDMMDFAAPAKLRKKGSVGFGFGRGHRDAGCEVRKHG
ncbi:unnamed protein product, partial [Effrenium voratum]